MFKKILYVLVSFLFVFIVGQFFIMGSINKSLFEKISQDTSMYDIYNTSFNKGFFTSEAEFKIAVLNSANQNNDFKIKMIFNNNIFSKNLLEGVIKNPFMDSEIKNENLAEFTLDNSLFKKNLLKINFIDVKLNGNGKLIFKKPELKILFDKEAKFHNLEINLEKFLFVENKEVIEIDNFNYQLNSDKGLSDITDIKDLNGVLFSNNIGFSKIKISGLIIDKLKLDWTNKIYTTNDTYNSKLKMNIYSLTLPEELKIKESFKDFDLKINMYNLPLIYPDSVSTLNPQTYLTLMQQSKSTLSIDNLSCSLDNKNINSNIDVNIDSKGLNANGNIVLDKDILKYFPMEFALYFKPKDDKYVLNFSFNSLNFYKNTLKINNQIMKMY